MGRLSILFACCLWGALTGWAVALATAQPGLLQGSDPAATLLAYGALACFGGGYLAGSAARGGTPERIARKAACLTAATAFAAKALAPELAGWIAVLIAAGVFGVLAGLVRTR